MRGLLQRFGRQASGEEPSSSVEPEDATFLGKLRDGIMGRRSFLRSVTAATVGVGVLGDVMLMAQPAEAERLCTWCDSTDGWYCYWYGYCNEFYPYCNTIYVNFDCYSCCAAGCCYTHCGCSACICRDGPYYVCSHAYKKCPFGDNFPCDGSDYYGCCGQCTCYKQGASYAANLTSGVTKGVTNKQPNSPPP